MKKAFTLIELIAVLLILLILAALIIPKLTQVSYKRNLMVCSQNLKKLGAAFQQYVLENDGYAPYNPNAGDLNPSDFISGGDYMLSYEVAYKLCPYLGDASHEKFRAGTLQVIRCPGNLFDFYPEGGKALNEKGNTASWDLNHNRQAPATWPAFHSIPRVSAGSECSHGYQIMDYQYNMNLGGIISPMRKKAQLEDLKEYYNTHNPFYKLDFVMRYPEEAVLFCDIHYASVRLPSNPNWYGYGYLTGLVQNGIWNDDAYTNNTNLHVGPVRTNELIHEGKGINAVFADGHVEFLAGTACYGAALKTLYDDLMVWGITYPIIFTRFKNSAIDPELNRDSQIPGVHGFRRGVYSMCIEHDEKNTNLELRKDENGKVLKEAIPTQTECFNYEGHGI